MGKPVEGRWSDAWRTREELRAGENSAVAIQKLLKRRQQALSAQYRGVTDDAIELANSIEHLARWGQAALAEEAVEIASLIELLSTMLENEIDNLPTSRR
jgi:hypothetical protein